MRHADVVIVGGGLAGSTAAAMLVRRGIDAAMVDPHGVYPPDLRCEKLDGRQLKILKRTGLAEHVVPGGMPIGEFWIARFGRVVEKRPTDQYGILYDTLVNTVRGAIPPGDSFIHDKVTAVANSADRQIVTLSSGAEISARLVIMANGLNTGLRHTLGMVREDVSKCHCVTLAFDLRPVGRPGFDFQALTYYAERPADRLAYITIFPVGTTMRANLMVYRRMDDAWLGEMRTQPDAAMRSIMPRLGRILGRAEVAGPVKVRPADLYMTRDYLQPGIVLVGDAFATSCPAAGTGTEKVFTDVERLCNVYVPRWMGSRGMGIGKIADFYADPEKVACDRHSFAEAFRLRSVSIDQSLFWRAQRWRHFLGRLAAGTAREAAARMSTRSPVASFPR